MLLKLKELLLYLNKRREHNQREQEGRKTRKWLYFPPGLNAVTQQKRERVLEPFRTTDKTSRDGIHDAYLVIVPRAALPASIHGKDLPYLKSCQPPNSRSHRWQRSKEPPTAPENLQSGGHLPHTISNTPAPQPLHTFFTRVPRHKRRARVEWRPGDLWIMQGFLFQLQSAPCMHLNTKSSPKPEVVKDLGVNLV